MTSAVESFVIELGRASKSSSYLLRGLQPSDRDDIIAAAVLWCWENRKQFIGPLDRWFREALQVARRKHGRGNRRASEELQEIAVMDTTARRGDAEIAADQLSKQLQYMEREIAIKIGEGHTLRSIANRFKISMSKLLTIQRKIRKLDPVLPDITEYTITPKAPDSDDDTRGLSSIDHEIEKLLRRPKHERADCPVCWRCCWFDGLTPKNYAPPTLVDIEICTAVAQTEARKIRIARGERL